MALKDCFNVFSQASLTLEDFHKQAKDDVYSKQTEIAQNMHKSAQNA